MLKGGSWTPTMHKKDDEIKKNVELFKQTRAYNIDVFATIIDTLVIVQELSRIFCFAMFELIPSK